MAYTPTYTRDRLGRFAANKDANFTQVVAGTDAYIMEDEFNQMQWIMNEARADLMRSQYHSGFLTGMTSFADVGTNRTVTNTGIMCYPITAFRANQFDMRLTASTGSPTDIQVLINGYKISLNKVFAGVVDIILPAPPAYGTRDDLVFLEAWFQEVSTATGAGGATDSKVYKYGNADNTVLVTNDLLDGRKGAETTRRIQLRWRIRTVAGVDFDRFPEGLGRWSGGSQAAPAFYNWPVQAQGGNSAPITGGDISYLFWSTDDRLAAGNAGVKNGLDDRGLYIAGVGDTPSKNNIKSIDGYSYAIPLFKVRRRNNGTYSEANPNGARDYIQADFTIPSTLQVGATIDATLTTNKDAFYAAVQAGDLIGWVSETQANSWRLQVLEKKANNVLSVKNIGTTAVGNTTGAYIRSERPDLLYSNIITINDITDLRHKISTTIQPQKEFEGAFDQLMRGQLRTSQPQVFQKETYGLRRAPLGITQELQPVTVVRPDGSKVQLVNLLGLEGGFEKGAAAWAVNNTSTVDDASNAMGSASARTLTATGATSFYTELNVASRMQTGKYYLLIANIRNINCSSAASVVWRFSDTNVGGTYNVNRNGTGVSAGSYGVSYIKIAPSDYNMATAANAVQCHVRLNAVASAIGQQFAADNVRFIEIDQATYNLVGVDSAWTSGDDIAAKFPYTESLPNFVENLVPQDPAFWSNNDINSSTGALSPSTTRLVSDFIAVQPNTNYVLSNAGLSQQELQWAEYDASGALVSASWLSTAAGRVRLTGPTTTKVRINTRYNPANTVMYPIEIQRFSLMLEKLYVGYARLVGSTGSVQIASPINPYVPFGRWYIPADYQGYNAPLGNRSIQHHYGVNGDSFSSQRSVFSDVATQESRTVIVDPLTPAQKNVTVTQATPGTWSANDTIKLTVDNGIITGGSPGARLVQPVNSGQSTIFVDDVSGFVVGDFIAFTDLTPSNISFGRTITAVDPTAKSITFTSATSVAYTTNFYVVKVVGTSNSTPLWMPTVGYTGQQSKLAPTATATTITLASDASSVTDFYKGMNIGVYGGKGAGQVRTITAYNGSTKVATVNTAWTTNPDNGTSVYTISLNGSWSVNQAIGAGTAVYTLAAGQPTAISDGTLGVANAQTIKLDYINVHPAGRGMSYIPEATYDAYVNGERMSVGGAHLKANISNKTSGSTAMNPHIVRYNTSSTLQNPGGGIECLNVGFSDYSRISALDGTVISLVGSTSGNVSQLIISFDCIRATEDKYGEIPAVDTAGKVAWLKANVSSMTADVYLWGSGPAGNKVTLAKWDPTNTTWANSTGSHTSGTVTKITNSSTVTGYIDANGFLHFCAYADASDGITASTVNLDYIEFFMSFTASETGYTVLTPDNPLPILNENVLPHYQAFPIDLTGFSAANATLSLDEAGTIKAVTSGLADNEGVEIFVPFKTSLAGDVYTASFYVKGSGRVRMYIVGSNTTSNTEQIIDLTGMWQRVSVRFAFSASTASVSIGIRLRTSGIQSATFYMQKAKLQRGYVTTDWVQGSRTGSLLNYFGKKAGSTLEIPHKMYVGSAPNKTQTLATLLSTQLNEATQTQYDGISKLDGAVTQSGNTGTGFYSTVLLEWDLAGFGMSLKELIAALRKFNITHTGYGEGANTGVKAYGLDAPQMWNDALQTWQNFGSATTNSTVTSVSANTDVTTTAKNYVTKDMKVYIKIHTTYPNDGAVFLDTNIYTDYVKLEITLAEYVDYKKSNLVKVRPYTKELKLYFPAHSYRYIGYSGQGQSDVVTMNYLYTPYQGLDALAGTSALFGVNAQAITMSKRLTEPKLMASTLGTGTANPSNLDMGYMGVASAAQLPMDFSEALYGVNQPQPQAEIPVGAAGYRMANTASPDHPLATLMRGDYPILPMGTGSSTSPVRGVRMSQGVQRWLDLTSELTAANLQNYMNRYAILALLFSYNDEWYLQVATADISDNKFWIGTTKGAMTFYKLPGRPLVKGV